jgi:GAF domain-containing protein
MYDHPLFVRTLSSFTKDLLTAYDADEMLQSLAEQVTHVLNVAGCGVSVASQDERLSFATAVPEHLALLERLQGERQGGPCYEAYTTGHVVAVADLREVQDRWGEYTSVAVDLGVLSVAGIPMSLQGHSIGAMNLYSAEVREWAEEDLAAAQALADMATGYLVNASKLEQQQQLTDQLTLALSSRVAIEQAKGVVAEAENISVDQAFQRIRRWARNHNATLRSVAQEVVERGLRP